MSSTVIVVNDHQVLSCHELTCHEPAVVMLSIPNVEDTGLHSLLACNDGGHQRNARKDLGQRSSAIIWSTPLMQGNYETPIVYLEAGSDDLKRLHMATEWCIEEGRHFRLRIDSDELKFKPGEHTWSHGIRSHKPNGGN